MTRSWSAAVLCSLAVGAVPASAETVVKGPGDLSIDCEAFRLYPNGTIESGKEGTLVYPDRKGSFAFATFGPRTVSANGIDLGEWVNKSCKR